MSAPLSTHSVRVPPRQTCHVRAEHHLRVEHPELAKSIALIDVSWDANHILGGPISEPRDALHLGVDPAHKLEARASSFHINPTKTVYVEVGNYSDTPLLVTFEIRGDS